MRRLLLFYLIFISLVSCNRFEKLQDTTTEFKHDIDVDKVNQYYLNYREEYCNLQDSVQKRNNAAIRLAINGYLKKARNRFKKMVALHPDNETLKYNLSLIEANLNDYEKLLNFTGDVSEHLEMNKNVAKWYKNGRDTTLNTISNNGYPGFNPVYAYNNSFITGKIGKTRSRYFCELKLRKAELLYKDSVISEAINVLKRLNNSECKVIAQINVANLILHTNPKKAIDILSEALRNKDRVYLAPILYSMGLASYISHDTLNAIGYWKRAIARDSLYCPAYTAIGNFFYTIGSYEKAKEYFLQATEIDKQDPVANYGLAMNYYRKTVGIRTYYVLYNLLNAKARLENIKINPSNPFLKEIYYRSQIVSGFITLKLSLYRKIDDDNVSQAYTYFKNALSINPKSSAAYTGLSLCAQIRENLNKALKNINKAISLEPNSSHLYTIKGAILYDGDNYSEAVSAYSTAYKLDSSDIEALNGLGISYRELQKYHASIDFLKQAVNLSKGSNWYDEYINSLAISYLDCREMHDDSCRYRISYDSIISLHKKAYTLGYDKSYLFNIGNVMYDSLYQKPSRDSIAIKCFRMGGANDLPYIKNNIGVVLALNGDKIRAKKFFIAAKIDDYKNYITPYYNLILLGEKVDREPLLWIKKEWGIVNNQHIDTDPDYFFTRLFHVRYLYRFEFRGNLAVNTPVRMIEMKPKFINDYRFLQCKNKVDRISRSFTIINFSFPRRERFNGNYLKCPKLSR